MPKKSEQPEYVLNEQCPQGHIVTTEECPVHGEGYAYCETCKSCDKDGEAHQAE